MHRNVGRVGDQSAVGVEDGAGKVQPFLDVDRVRRVGQHRPHLFGHAHEQVVEDFQHHRVGAGASGPAGGARGDAAQDQMALGQDLGPPARFDHRGGVVLDHHGRAVHLMAGAQHGAGMDGGIAPGAGAEHAGVAQGLGGALGRFQGGQGRRFAAARHFDGGGFHHQGPAIHDEAEAGAMGGGKGLGDAVQRTEGDVQGSVRALVFDFQRTAGAHVRALDALAFQLAAGDGFDVGHGAVDRRHAVGGQGGFQPCFLQHPQVGQTHAIGRQHPGQGMQDHHVHGQLVGHQTGVLTAGTAEAGQGVAGDVVAAGDADLLDGVGHVHHRDGQEAFGHLFRAAAGPFGQSGKAGPGRRHVQGLVGPGAEHLGEVVRMNLAQGDVAIGDRQGAAAPIAGGAGIGAGRMGADPEPRPVIAQHRAAAGRHRVDVHDGGAHPDAGDHGVEAAFKGAVIVPDIGGGAAHVEADDGAKAGLQAGGDAADHAAGRPRQDGILALEAPRVGQPARALHEHQA